MSNAKSQIELKAKPISHWQYATLMDVRSGRARQRAREAKTTTLRLLNAQTLSSLLYRGYVDCDRNEEPWITDLGEAVIARMTGTGRYRNLAGEVTDRVRAYLTARRRRSRLLSIRRGKAAA